MRAKEEDAQGNSVPGGVHAFYEKLARADKFNTKEMRPKPKSIFYRDLVLEVQNSDHRLIPFQKMGSQSKGRVEEKRVPEMTKEASFKKPEIKNVDNVFDKFSDISQSF